MRKILWPKLEISHKSFTITFMKACFDQQWKHLAYQIQKTFHGDICRSQNNISVYWVKTMGVTFTIALAVIKSGYPEKILTLNVHFFQSFFMCSAPNHHPTTIFWILFERFMLDQKWKLDEDWSHKCLCIVCRSNRV